MGIKRRLKQRQPFFYVGIAMLFFIVVPIIFSLRKLLETSKQWLFIVENLLYTYVTQSVILVLSVVFLSVVIGICSAVIVTKYEFKGRKLLEVLLYLPMAVPPYVLSYIYVDTLSFQGRIYRLFQAIGIQLHMNVFSLSMAILVLSLSLYPYIYIPMKAYFRQQDDMYDDAAKLLHMSWVKRMIKIHIPMLMPTLISASMFVLFEAMNDYGVSKYLNIKTLTVGMFDTWFQFNDITAAFYLAFIYIGFIILITLLYQLYHRHKHVAKAGHYQKKHPSKLTGSKSYVYIGLLWTLIVVSLGIPLFELILNVFSALSTTSFLPFIEALFNTLVISLLASGIIMMIALLMGNFYRFVKHKWLKKLSNIVVIGYALPGVMIALIYYVFFIELDMFFSPIYNVFNRSGLVLSLSIWMLIAAFVFRFFAIGYRQVIASYASIGMKQTLAAYTLHTSKFKTLFLIDVPMIKKGFIAGFIISFVDIVKELPMTLLLRPFNMQTLSTLTYTYMNNEDIIGASLPSLAIVIVSMALILILTRKRKEHYVS